MQHCPVTADLNRHLSDRDAADGRDAEVENLVAAYERIATSGLHAWVEAIRSEGLIPEPYRSPDDIAAEPDFWTRQRKQKASDAVLPLVQLLYSTFLAWDRAGRTGVGFTQLEHLVCAEQARVLRAAAELHAEDVIGHREDRAARWEKAA